MVAIGNGNSEIDLFVICMQYDSTTYIRKT